MWTIKLCDKILISIQTWAYFIYLFSEIILSPYSEK